MLARFVNAFASRPRPSILLWLVLVVFGVLSFLVFLPREGFPPVDAPIAVGAGAFFVDDQNIVDDQVTQPLAEAAIARDEVESILSFSQDSTFSAIVNLSSGVSSAEGAAVLDEIIAEGDFPEEAQFFTQSINAARFNGEFDLLIGVFGPIDATVDELEAAANAIVGDITSPDFAEVVVDTQLESGVNPATGEEVVLQTSFNLLTNDSNEFLPSIAIGVNGQPGVDSIGLRDAAQAAIDDARGGLPDGFTTLVAIDSARVVEQQISSLQSNVLLGVIVVAIVALLLISWRASILTSLFLFTVLSVSVGALFIVGITLNTISLFALILALGLFVDDAIVITESIDAFRDDEQDEGDEAEQDLSVIRRAIKRVGAASASGTITTVLVFAPMLLIGGILGGFIRILPITIILALVISLLLSFMFIPVGARFLTLRAPKASGPLVRAEEMLAEVIGRLPAARGGKGVAIGIAGFLLSIVLFGIGVGVFAPRVGFNIFPALKDSTAIGYEITYPPGTDVETAQEIALELNQAAEEVVGDELLQGYLFFGTAGSALGQFDLTPIGGRPTSSEIIEDLAAVTESRDDARIVFSSAGGGPPELLFPFTMQVFGDDIDTLTTAAQELRADIDGRQLTLGNGDPVNVVEAIVALNDVVARDYQEDGIGRRYVEVRARFDDSNVTSTIDAAQTFFEENYDAERLAGIGLEEDALGFDFGFESDNQEAFAALPIAFGIALIAMMVLLIIQFRSSTQWMLVFTAIPFSFFGLFGGLLITDNPLSFFVMLGILGLIGIAVNNSILLVDFANQEIALGAEMNAAIATALRRRFRPLVATSLTTVGGLLPLALSDPFWEALAFTIIFGLLSSTFLVLFSFPYYYLALQWLRERAPGRNLPLPIRVLITFGIIGAIVGVIVVLALLFG